MDFSLPQTKTILGVLKKYILNPKTNYILFYNKKYNNLPESTLVVGLFSTSIPLQPENNNNHINSNCVIFNLNVGPNLTLA